MKSTSSLEGPNTLQIFAFEPKPQYWLRRLVISIGVGMARSRCKLIQKRARQDGSAVNKMLDDLVTLNDGLPR